MTSSSWCMYRPILLKQKISYSCIQRRTFWEKGGRKEKKEINPRKKQFSNMHRCSSIVLTIWLSLAGCNKHSGAHTLLSAHFVGVSEVCFWYFKHMVQSVSGTLYTREKWEILCQWHSKFEFSVSMEFISTPELLSETQSWLRRLDSSSLHQPSSQTPQLQRMGQTAATALLATPAYLQTLAATLLRLQTLVCHTQFHTHQAAVPTCIRGNAWVAGMARYPPRHLQALPTAATSAAIKRDALLGPGGWLMGVQRATSSTSQRN